MRKPELPNAALLFVLTLLFGTASSAATLTGSTVNGAMVFNNGGGNQFDLGNGGSGPTAVIGDNSPTFFTVVGLSDLNLSADFLSNQLDISFAPYRAGGPFEAFQLTFQDSAFNGLDLSLLSFSGPFTSTSDFSYSLHGDTITFNVADNLPDTNNDDPYTADLSISDVPEPSPSLLLLLGAILVGTIRYVRSRKLA